MILRSMLFVPGNNLRMIHKAATLPADAIILDLEDAVPIDEKETARIFIKDSISQLKKAGATVFVRVNALSTDLTYEDLDFSIQEGIDGIMIPKCQSKTDIDEILRMIKEFEKKRGVEKVLLVPLIETPLGVINSFEIAASSDRVIALAFGAVDFSREMGISISSDQIELLYARSRIATSARAIGKLAIDTVWTDIMDMDGLIKEAERAKRLGFSGKLLIHPKQIDPVNKIFTPSEDEVNFARRICKEFEESMKIGKGAISIDGKMVDLADYKRAKQILEIFEEIKRKEERFGK